MSIKKQTIYKCDICGEEIIVDTKEHGKNEGLFKNPLTNLTLPCSGGESGEYTSTITVDVCSKCLDNLSKALKKSGYDLYDYYGLRVNIDEEKLNGTPTH